MIIITAKGIPSKTLPLPTAEKPLVKGHNFFASGNVGEILVNLAEKFTHIRTTVLASMRNTKYDVKVVLDNKTGLVVQASCKCPAGSGGKCNHVAALLFALVDYIQTMRNPDSCTIRANPRYGINLPEKIKNLHILKLLAREKCKNIYLAEPYKENVLSRTTSSLYL